MSSDLLRKQMQFPYLLSLLITWAYENGYQITLGEAYRSDEQSEINAIGPVLRERLADMIVGIPQFAALAAKIRNNVGSGIRTSLHGDRLAIDLNVFVNGEYQSETKAYQALGEEWERLGGTWGGRFKNPDGNHFSVAFEGRA